MRAASVFFPLALAFAMASTVSCDEDSEADAADDLCRSVGTTICAEACACGDCTILTSGGSATVSFDNESDCTAIYVDLGCQEPDDSIDLQACSSDLESASCADDPNGDSALGLPASCE